MNEALTSRASSEPRLCWQAELLRAGPASCRDCNTPQHARTHPPGREHCPVQTESEKDNTTANSSSYMYIDAQLHQY